MSAAQTVIVVGREFRAGASYRGKMGTTVRRFLGNSPKRGWVRYAEVAPPSAALAMPAASWKRWAGDEVTP